MLVAPAATVTDAGTVRLALLLDSETTAPPAGAAWLSATVQVEVPAELSDPGLQLRLLTVTLTDPVTVIVPPVPLADRPDPLADAKTTPVTPIGTVPDALPASVTATVATVPFWIMFWLGPERIHV